MRDVQQWMSWQTKSIKEFSQILWAYNFAVMVAGMSCKRSTGGRFTIWPLGWKTLLTWRASWARGCRRWEGDDEGGVDDGMHILMRMHKICGHNMTLLKCWTDDDDLFSLQTGRRLEEAANSEVGKELGKVEYIIIIFLGREEQQYHHHIPDHQCYHQSYSWSRWRSKSFTGSPTSPKSFTGSPKSPMFVV